MPIYRLSSIPTFPPGEKAEPNGLLAIGGDLAPERLLEAYRQGIFPWYEEGQPLLWWSPDPRLILEPEQIKISRSLKKVLKKEIYEIRRDTVFSQVVQACATVRARKREGTWITDPMREAYSELHHQGYAHSVETWFDGKLVGGLYGLFLGRCFFGESMFSVRTDASKVALVALAEQMKRLDVHLIDCQVTSQHLLSMGAKEMARSDFLRRLKEGLRHPTIREMWR